MDIILQKKLYLFILLLISCFNYTLAVSSSETLEVFESATLQVDGKMILLEIADTTAKRQQGLMFRTSLADQSGMLFIYPHSGNHRIWMKNTLIPLTVVWLDENAIVIGIKKLEPCKQVNCPSFGVKSPAKYIIEFNDKFSGIKPGDSLTGIRLLN